MKSTIQFYVQSIIFSIVITIIITSGSVLESTVPRLKQTELVRDVDDNRDSKNHTKDVYQVGGGVGGNMEKPNIQTQHKQEQQQKQEQRNIMIVGGQPANSGEYPSFGYNGCGGTLIHPDIFLTAAHCKGNFFFNIAIGGILLDGSDSTEIVKVDYEIRHPNYRILSLRNDIMIVKLSQLSTAPIQQLNYDPTIPKTNDIVTTIGFGRTTQTNYNLSDILHEVNVSIVDSNICKDVYADINKRFVLCASVPEGGKDSCHGDSGGPLYLVPSEQVSTSTSSSNSSTSNSFDTTKQQSLLQIGITSFGYGCARPEYPGVYTRISSYKRFIQQMICAHSSIPPTDCSRLLPSHLDCPCGPYQWICRIRKRCFVL